MCTQASMQASLKQAQVRAPKSTSYRIWPVSCPRTAFRNVQGQGMRRNMSPSASISFVDISHVPSQRNVLHLHFRFVPRYSRATWPRHVFLIMTNTGDRLSCSIDWDDWEVLRPQGSTHTNDLSLQYSYRQVAIVEFLLFDKREYWDASTGCIIWSTLFAHGLVVVRSPMRALLSAILLVQVRVVAS